MTSGPALASGLEAISTAWMSCSSIALGRTNWCSMVLPVAMCTADRSARGRSRDAMLKSRMEGGRIGSAAIPTWRTVVIALLLLFVVVMGEWSLKVPRRGTNELYEKPRLKWRKLEMLSAGGGVV